MFLKQSVSHLISLLKSIFVWKRAPSGSGAGAALAEGIIDFWSPFIAVITLASGAVFGWLFYKFGISWLSSIVTLQVLSLTLRSLLLAGIGLVFFVLSFLFSVIGMRMAQRAWHNLE
jgi:hypothetical protein